MDKDQADRLVIALQARGVIAAVDTDQRGQYCVVITDSRDTVWWSPQEGWSWGPQFEHAVYANAVPVLVAHKIVTERESCDYCRKAVER